jgi:phosphomannomutase
MVEERLKRTVTNNDILKYEKMVEKYLRDSVKKNWNEASLQKSKDNCMLGTTGWTMEDMRQHLRMEVCVALTKYDPNRETKESTFVFQHLFNRIGQLMKKLTNQSYGYGKWHVLLEQALWEKDAEQ